MEYGREAEKLLFGQNRSHLAGPVVKSDFKNVENHVSDSTFREVLSKLNYFKHSRAFNASCYNASFSEASGLVQSNKVNAFYEKRFKKFPL